VNLLSPSYAFVTSLFKAEEAKGITTPMMQEALRKSSIEDAITAMKGSSIGDYLEKNLVKTFEEANSCLQAYIDDCLNRILILRPPSDVVLISSVYMQKFDVFNVKIALRRLLDEEGAPFVSAGTMYKSGLLNDLSTADSTQDIAEILTRCSLHHYAQIIQQLEEIDLRAVVKAEMDLDIQYVTQMQQKLSKVNDAHVLKKALGIMVDIMNLRILLRSVFTNSPVKKDTYMKGGGMFSPEKLTSLAELKIPELSSSLEHTRYANMIRDVVKAYDVQKDIRTLESISDVYQLRFLKELLSPKVFSPVMAFSLLTVKDWEIRTTRIVLKAVADSLPASAFTDYLEL
jgi:vacuolar-type H+-ATPase subunit C/Vma6